MSYLFCWSAHDVFLKSRVKAASKRVKSGDFLTQEEVDKEVENW